MSSKSRKFSEEHKKKIGESNRGKPSKYKGIPRTDETKQKISDALKGKRATSGSFQKGDIPWIRGLTKETDKRVQKISEARKGRPTWNKGLTKETDERIEKLANIPWNKGKTKDMHTQLERSKKSRQKMSESHKGKKLTDEHKEKIRQKMLGRPSPMKGRHHTEEAKRKIGRFFKGRKRSPEEIKKYMKHKAPSTLEEDFMKIIDKHDLPYAFVGNGLFMIEGLNPDFVNTDGEKIAIEVYARYYKVRSFANIESWKEKRSEIFKKYGWKMLFFDETQVKEDIVLKSLSL